MLKKRPLRIHHRDKTTGSLCTWHSSVNYGLFLHNCNWWYVSITTYPFDLYLLCSASVLCLAVFSLERFQRFF